MTLSPCGGTASHGRARQTAYSAGHRRGSSAHGTSSQSPMSISRSTGRISTVSPCDSATAFAVVRARNRSDAYTASSGTSANRFARQGSCSYARGVSRLSYCPWQRR